VAEPKDVKSLHHSTHLNKDLEGFKTRAGKVDHDDVMMCTGHYDQSAASTPLPHLSKDNIQVIGTRFLKMQHMIVPNVTLFASTNDNVT
jgi:hypothetical protein